LPMDDYQAQADLCAYSKVAITGGELHSSGYPELKMMVEKHCYDTFQPDAIMSGGISQSLAIAKLCRENGLKFTPHTWTNGIGFAVNLQVMLASGFAENTHMEYPINPPSWTVEKRDAILTEPFVHERGTLSVANKAGLGFEINEKVIKRYGKRYFKMGKKKLIWHTLCEKGLSADYNRQHYGVDVNKSKKASSK